MPDKNELFQWNIHLWYSDGKCDGSSFSATEDQAVGLYFHHQDSGLYSRVKLERR